MSNLMPAALAKLFPHADTDDLPDAPPKKRKSDERDLQRRIVTMIRRYYPALIVAAIPNEVRGNARTDEERARYGAARKASGVLSGHPDLIVYLPGGRLLLWELKSSKGRLSPTQQALHPRLAALGFPVELIRDEETARLSIKRAMEQP